jgi:hypothetical protein
MQIKILERNLHTHVYISTIYNCQDMEAAWVLNSRWLDKDNVMHVCNEVLTSQRRKMDGTGSRHVKQDKSSSETQTLHVFTHAEHKPKKKMTL